MKPRAKIIPDKLFFKLWKAANEGYDKHNYISNFTSSTSVDFVDFKNKYGIYYEEATEMLSNIYEAVNMPFDELIKNGKEEEPDTGYLLHTTENSRRLVLREGKTEPVNQTYDLKEVSSPPPWKIHSCAV